MAGRLATPLYQKRILSDGQLQLGVYYKACYDIAEIKIRFLQDRI